MIRAASARHRLYSPTPVRAGFTLIELLVGLTISTLILAATATFFATVLRSWDQGGQVLRLQQSAQATGDLIERHLRMAAPAGGVFFGEDLSDGQSHGHRLVLTSRAQSRFPRRLPPTDQSEIELTLDPAEGDGLKMRIDSTPDDEPEEGGYSISLCPMATSFEVYYFDGQEWLEEWSEEGLPRAVEFHVTLRDEGEDAAGPRTLSLSRLVSLPVPKAAPAQEAMADASQGANAAQPGGQPPQGGQPAAQ